MRIRVFGAAAALAVGLAGCSGTQSKAPAAQPTSGATSAAAHAGSTPTTPAQPVYSISVTYSQVLPPQPDKPVAALLAKVDPPIDPMKNPAMTTNVPKARPEWIAAVTKTTDDGKPLASQSDISLNFVALVDEAAKTSDLDSLLKLCYHNCDSLKQAMPAVAARGRTGFQQLSLLLERTHPALGYSQATTWDYPGFNAPQHGAATTIDQQDMRFLGVGSTPYAGFRTQFGLMDDGPNGGDGWAGLVTDQ